MTVRVSYATDLRDPYDNVPDEDRDKVLLAEVAELERIVKRQARHEKAYIERLHPRDEHGRFAEKPGGLSDVTAGWTPEGVRQASKLDGLIHSGPDPVASKIRNVKEIGEALAKRAKKDPKLRAQLDAVGDKYLAIQGTPLHPDEPVAGTQYMRDHLHYEPGMSATELGAREIAAKMQDTWMMSASDSSPASWGMQVAVADRLGSEKAFPERFTLQRDDVESILGIGPLHEGQDPREPQERAQRIANSPAVKAYVDEVYNRTQAFLKEHDLTEITLYRGIGYSWGEGSDPFRAERNELPEFGYGGQDTDADRQVRPNPASSWSTDPEIATDFARDQGTSESAYVFTATVPAERIWSLPVSGPGCTNETEAIVAGGDRMNVRVARAL